MKRCCPVKQRGQSIVKLLVTATTGLLMTNATAKAVEDDQVVLYEGKSFDESLRKFPMRLDPGRRCAVVNIRSIFPLGNSEFATPRSMRLGKQVGAVLRGHGWFWICRESTADVSYAGRRARDVVLYWKTGDGYPPGASFSTHKPLAVLGSGVTSYKFFYPANEKPVSSHDLDVFKDNDLRWLTVWGADTEVRAEYESAGKNPAYELYTSKGFGFLPIGPTGGGPGLIEGMPHHLFATEITVTAPLLPHKVHVSAPEAPDAADTAMAAESGTSNIAGVQTPDVPHSAGAVTSVGKISGKWGGMPMSVTFAQTGEVVSGVVDPDNFEGGLLLGTLTKNVLDFWFGDPDNLMSGQLTFAADGMSAKGYFQSASGGDRTTWVVKRLGGSIL